MSEKPKTALAATSILALAVATAALALSGYGVYQASQGPTTEALDELENKLAARLAAAQEQLDGSFENRVEAALESIVASRQEAKERQCSKQRRSQA